MKKRVSAVFQPTESITQQMMDDWIAGCLEMLAQAKFNKFKFGQNIFEATDEDDKDVQYDKSPLGKSIDNIIVDAIEEEVGPTINESQSEGVTPSSLCSSKFSISPTCSLRDTVSCHDILARLDVSNENDRQELLNLMVEDKAVLKSLITHKFGVSVLRRIFPLIQPGGAAAIASELQGMIVEVSSDPHGSVFLQEFIRLFFNTEMVDILLEEVMDNLSTLAVHDNSTWLVMEVIKRDDKPRAGNLMRVACWVVKNVEIVMLSSAGATLARMVVQLLMSRINSKEVSSFRGLLGNLVSALLDTTADLDGVEMPLILKAAEHPYGHIVVLELAASKSYLVENRDRMVQILTQYKSKLEIGTFGCLVVKGMHGWL